MTPNLLRVSLISMYRYHPTNQPTTHTGPVLRFEIVGVGPPNEQALCQEIFLDQNFLLKRYFSNSFFYPFPTKPVFYPNSLPIPSLSSEYLLNILYERGSSGKM